MIHGHPGAGRGARRLLRADDLADRRGVLHLPRLPPRPASAVVSRCCSSGLWAAAAWDSRTASR
ncbi:hypothetical protein ACRAWF_23790 [Streptomyces sp. L7]